MKRLLLFINPTSRQGSEILEQIEKHLLDLQLQVVNSRQDWGAKDPAAVIRRHRHDCDVVVVSGGDGSINKLLDAVIECKLPLHVIPAGTANNFARTLDIPKDLLENLKILAAGKTRSVDVGVVNGIRFLTVVGMGVSVMINQNASSKLKRIFGVFGFLLTALSLVRRINPFHVEVSDSSGKRRTRSWQITVCNGKYYGSGFKVAEEASLEDGQFDVVSSEMNHWTEMITHIPKLITGRSSSAENLHCWKTDMLTIRTRHSHKVDVDGDIRTRTPLELHVEPLALQVVVP